MYFTSFAEAVKLSIPSSRWPGRPRSCRPLAALELFPDDHSCIEVDDRRQPVQHNVTVQEQGGLSQRNFELACEAIAVGRLVDQLPPHTSEVAGRHAMGIMQ